MERPFTGRWPGGILSLDILIEAYPAAIKSDLIDRGLRLRDLCEVDDFNWDDLHAIVASAGPKTALARAFRGKDSPWQLNELLLADVADSLHWLIWAKTENARRKRGMPKPIPRPGIKEPERIGDAPVSINEMNDFLGWKVVA